MQAIAEAFIGETENAEEQALTKDDTYEIGASVGLENEKPCSCHSTNSSTGNSGADKIGSEVSSVGFMGEPMVAIAEPIRTLRVEKINRTRTGEFAFETIAEVDAGEYGACEDSPICLPMFHIEKDPDKFRKCLEISRKFGAIKDSNKLYDLIKQMMTAQDQECLLVIMFDTQLYVRGVSVVARGARDRVAVPIPDVLRLPLMDGATAFAVAHNHPSGSPTPSQADEHLTTSLRKAAEAVNVDLFDHIVVGADGYYSFRANKWKRTGKSTKRS